MSPYYSKVYLAIIAMIDCPKPVNGLKCLQCRDGAAAAAKAAVAAIESDPTYLFQARDASRWNTLHRNITYMHVNPDYPSVGPNIPVLAMHSKRIWYHATNNMDATFEGVVDRIRAQNEQENNDG